MVANGTWKAEIGSRERDLSEPGKCWSLSSVHHVDSETRCVSQLSRTERQLSKSTALLGISIPKTTLVLPEGDMSATLA